MKKATLADGQLKTLLPFQAEVKKVHADGSCDVRVSENDFITIPPPYYGGASDAGAYMHPSEGDLLLCVRVSGSHGTTQAIAVLASSNRDSSQWKSQNDSTLKIGSAPYPQVESGDYRIASEGGSEIHLKGNPLDSEIHLATAQRSGVYITSNMMTDSVTTVGHMQQNISSASRLISGEVIRRARPGQTDTDEGHELQCITKISGGKRGLFPGVEGSNSSTLGAPRNPTLSEWRLCINEFSEQSAMTGFEGEYDIAGSSNIMSYESEYDKRAIDPRSTLSLSPHQLIEIVGGNLVNTRGECLDINYGTVDLGDSSGRPVLEKKDYEGDRLKRRRGVGYHFQLSTQDKSDAKPNDTENFIFALDKEGCLKANIPKSSGSGNVCYPTFADFSDSSGGVVTKPLAPSVAESIPVTLRDKKNKVILPQVPASKEMGPGAFRMTGIRFANNDGYFQNLDNIGEDGGSNKVRVNFTAHHNMYAAAEMLIANTIKKVLIPTSASVCPGFVLGNATVESFERFIGNLDGSGKLKNNELPYMSTVAVAPGKPAIYPGGATTVAGKDTSTQKEGKNQPYTNSFTIGMDKEGKLTYSNVDKGVGGQKNPGGKSANINFEGAVDVSVGKDEYDRKSLVLDTAGSVISWFGRDQAGRSLVVQTDGDVAINVGGRGIANGEEAFREGRFDLRVNVTDKGVVGDEGFRDPDGAANSDFIISISSEGLVIAGMKQGAPMIIRNQGDLSLETAAKLILHGSSVEVREGNTVPRKTWKAPTAADQEAPDPEKIAEKITCITDLLSSLSEDME